MNENSATTDRILLADDAAKATKGKAMGRASRTTARSALVAAVMMVMALAALLGTTKPALAAPVSRASEQSANTGTATARLSPAAFNNRVCKIDAEYNECESTDRLLEVFSTNTGDTAACTFTWKMYWGDVATGTVTRDGADGPSLIFKAAFIFPEPRETTTYQIDWEAVSATGGCHIGSGYGYFTVLVPPR